MEILIASIAESNGGYLTRADALAYGLRDRDLREAVRFGLLRRIRHGCYAPAATYDRLSDSQKHCVLVRAVVRRARGKVAVTHESACCLRGYAMWGVDLRTVNLTRLDGASSRTEAGVRHHRVRDDLGLQLELQGGMLVTTAARSVWDALTQVGIESGLVIADSALRANTSLEPELLRLGKVFRFRPGSRSGRLALSLADGKAESPGESRSRYLFWRYSIPRPDLQYEVYDSRGVLVGRTDFAWLLYRHLGEFDGLVKYRRIEEGDDPSAVVIREKLREDKLRAERFGMSRLVWSDLSPARAAAVAASVRSDLEQSRRLYTRNRVFIA